MADKETPLSAVELIRVRNDFYIKGYRKLILAMIYSLFFCLLLIILLIYFYLTQAKPIYFATGEQCQLVPMVPLSAPYVSDAKVVTWSRSAIVDILDYNYNNYEGRLSDVQKYFTGNGYKNYKNSLEASGNLNTLIGKRMSTVGKLFGNPKIVEKGNVLVDGVSKYAWVVQVNALLNYESSLANITECARILLRIFRTSPLENPVGIGINSFISDTMSPKKKVDGTCEFT
jgi:hypothetical protein